MIQLVRNNAGITLQRGALKGDDGGYYIPYVNEDGVLSWVASEDYMPEVESANIRGEEGKPGVKGDKGDSGVYVGSEAPTDDSLIWINPEGEATEGFATKQYVDNAIANIKIPEGGNVDLTGYATEEYVDKAIAGIKIPEPDLSAYATKKELEEALAAIVDGEEVSY